MGEHFGEYVFAGFDKARVGFDRPCGLAGGVTLTEIQAQALDDLPGVWRQQNQVRGEKYCFFNIVGNQEYGFGGALPDLQQQLLHLFAGEGVEGAERFVHQQHARIGGERTGQADTLLLATGQLPDPPIFETGKVHQCEHFPSADFTFVPGDTGQFQTEADIAREKRELRAREMLALVDLSGFENRRIWQLSGGQKQRVGLARALAADQVITLGAPTTKAITDTAVFLKEQGKVEAVLPDYAPYVSAKFITN